VIFPPAPWYDYWTGMRVTHVPPPMPAERTAAQSTNSSDPSAPLESQMVHPRIDLLPVYVRGGSILPMQPLVQDTEQRPNGPLEIRIYPGPDCKGTLYQDDGNTFDYKNGSYLRVNYTCEASLGNVTPHMTAQSGNLHPWWKKVQVSLYDWPSAQVRATLNGKAVTENSYDMVHRILHVAIPQSSQADDLRITVLK